MSQYIRYQPLGLGGGGGGSVTTGNLTDVGTDGIVITGGTGAVVGSGTSVAQHVADTTHNGYLSSTDWNTFNNKQSTLTLGNLTSTPATNLVVTGGTGAVIGSGALLTLTGASLVEATSSVLTITGATNAVLGTGVSIQVKQASTSVSGYLSNTDWNIFNGKQAAGNYITSLIGDGTASGPGSSVLTLATVNSNVGSFTNASITVNAKGLVTAASAGTAPVIAISVATANGLAGTSSGGATPVLTLSTTVNAPALSGNGTAIAAATTTGSGSTVVLATSPTLTSPIVGTQAQGDSSTKAASTSYVDVAVANAVSGVNPATAVQAATTLASDTSSYIYNNGASGIGATFTGAVNTALTIDGYTFTALGQRLLVKNDTQSPSGAFNGIYYVTQIQTAILPLILTRTLDYDQPSDINNTGAIPIINGTLNGTTSWVETALVVTVGTTPLVFTKFTRNPADYLLVANNLSDVASKPTSFNNLSPNTTKGDVTTYSTTNIRHAVPGDNGMMVPDSGQTDGWRNAAYNNFQNGRPGKNYIQYGDFENNATTGYSLGTVTLTSNLPSGVPTFGSGASGNLTLSATASGPLAGTYSLSLASSAATTAGNFIATSALTLDIEDQAKVLAFKFYYSPTVNPTNGNFSGTSSNSFGVAIYDVTNSAWIIPGGVFNFVQNSGVGICQGTFQTPSNMTSFRVVVYNANATAGAITMLYDDFYCGPQALAFGPAMSDWVAYTPTFTGFGTVSSVQVESRRVGDTLEVRGTFTSGTSTAVEARMTLGYNGGSANVTSSDTTKIPAIQYAGYGVLNANAAAQFTMLIEPSVGYFTFSEQGGANSGLTKINGSALLGIGNSYSFQASCAISGWSSNSVMSADSNTRVVAMKSRGQPTGTLSNSPNITKFPGATNDTNAAYSAATGLYTVQVSGWYEVSANVVIAGGTATVGQYDPCLYVYKNGAEIASNASIASGTATGNSAGSISSTDLYNAGDTIGIYTLSDRNTGLSYVASSGNSGTSTLSIKAITGPAVVAASDSVNFAYTGTATSTSSGVDTTITVSTKVRDSNNTYSGGTYTVPISGMYIFSGYISITEAAGVVSRQTSIKRNGTAIGIWNADNAVATNSSKSIGGTIGYPCIAGDTITLTFLQTSGTITPNNTVGTNFTGFRAGN